MSFIIEVKRKEKVKKFGFEDLELYHQECYGGEVVQECVNDSGPWECKCTRCNDEILRLFPKETILIIRTAIDGQEREFSLSDRRVVVVQRGKAETERPVFLEKEARTMGNMSKWVTRKEAKSWEELHSTSERRLLTVDSGSPIEVIRIGKYRVPLLRRYDSIAFVSMGPKEVKVSLEGNAGTSDGVAVEGKVSVQVIIKDEESCIKRIATDPEEEECLLRNSILTAVQETIVSHTWHLVISVTEELVQTAQQKLSVLLDQTASCFEVKGLTIQEISPQNKEIAELLEKAARAKEEEKSQRDLTDLRAERAVLERKAKEAEIEHELQMQKLQHQGELEAEREKLKLEQEKEDAQISTQQKLSELLKTEAGRIAALPTEMFKYLEKELEVRIFDQKEREKFILDLLKAGQPYGQLHLLRAVLAQHIGLRISEELPIPPSGEEKETQQIVNELKESSTTTESTDD